MESQKDDVTYSYIRYCKKYLRDSIPFSGDGVPVMKKIIILQGRIFYLYIACMY